MEKMEFSGKQKAEAMQYQWTKRADVWKTEALVLILQRRDTFPCPLQSGGMDRNETFRHPCKLVCAL